jgi:hypothetical protein
MNLNNNYDLVIVTPAYEDVDSAKLLMLDLFKNLGRNIFIVIVTVLSHDLRISTNSQDV